MTYQEIKTALRTLQAQDHKIPALNSKKEVLEAALAEILASITPEIVEAVTPEAIEPTAPEIIEPTTPSTVTNYDTTPSVEITTTTEPKRISIKPEHPALTEIREIAKGVEIVLIWAIAVIRAIIRFSTPHLKRAAEAGLKIIVYAAVLFQVWLIPKVELLSYRFGLWLLTVPLKIQFVGYQLGIWGLQIAFNLKKRVAIA